MSGVMWWNYELDGIRGKLMRAATVPLLGSRPIKITDIDGENIDVLGKLQTRAFIEDKTITVYAIYMNGIVRDDYTFKVGNTDNIDGKVTSIQWIETSIVDGVTKLIDAEGENENIFSLTLPARSITRFTFTLK